MLFLGVQMSLKKQFFGGVDAGGTTFKCGVSDASGAILKKQRVPVTTPEETLQGCFDFFQATAAINPLSALGIASFGPLDINPNSAAFGTILKTPKPNWAGLNLRTRFERSLNVPVAIDSDVNGALLAEMRFGAAQHSKAAAYITVGTGIGAGIFQNGGFVGRPSHPEFGHIPINRNAEDHDFDGICPFHGDCLEGMASAPAMSARWGDPETLSPKHPGWPIIADYLAQACRVLSLTMRLEKIILGGGLMLAPHLLGLVRDAYDEQMSGYLGDPSKPGGQLISSPDLGDDAGLIGALLMAQNATRPDRQAG